MTIHVAANTGCNLGCTYCYEEPDRQMSQKEINAEYDIDEIMETLNEYKEDGREQAPGLHGGEPLLLKDEHMEKIFEFCHEHWGSSHIQTNGTLIEDYHIEMFKKYGVSVGISCDGPEGLNEERVARSGSVDVTNKMTQRTQANLQRCLDDDEIGVGVITVIHKSNAGTDEKLEKLLNWMDNICKNGGTGHYNPAIPYEDIQEDLSLSKERLKEVYARSFEWATEEEYRNWGPFDTMIDNLLGLSLGSCVNGQCDVFNTVAAQSIQGDGEWSGCGKTWSAVGDGVPFLMGESSDNEFGGGAPRYETLKQIPGKHSEEVENGDVEDQGGCKGCKYWNVCQGGCPAAGLEDDHRNRTRNCDAKYETYQQMEDQLRGLMPSIDLITAFNWDEDASLGSPKQNFKPFAGISPDLADNPSAHNGSHKFGSVYDRAKIERDFEDIVEDYKEKYDESILTIEPQERSIHADSSGNY